MTQRIKVENMKDGGVDNVTIMIFNKTKGPDILAEFKILKPGESEELYVYNGHYISVVKE